MNIQQFCKIFVGMVLIVVLVNTMSLAQETYQIYAPPTPSSIPLIIAAQNMEDVNLTIFSNHSQANTLFLRGDVPILSTGLSVGINFYKNDVPVQIVNSYVSGLSYLVTRGKKVESFGEIKGQNIYLPFEGSPIEEVTRFFVEQEGLDLKKDFQVVYSQFPASLELLKRGKADNVVLPQPLAIIAAAQDDIFLSFAYKNTWEAATGNPDGYPQVGTFVKKEWAEEHRELLTRLNEEIANALELIKNDPKQAVALTKDSFKFPEKILLASLSKIDFSLSTSQQLKQALADYYQILEQAIDETFDAFFYLDPQ